MNSNSPQKAESSVTYTSCYNQQTLTGFIALATENPPIKANHPVTTHLQDFMVANVLTADTQEGRHEQLVAFAATLAEITTNPEEPLPAQFKQVQAALSQHNSVETPQGRMSHAIRKVGIDQGLTPPQW